MACLRTAVRFVLVVSALLAGFAGGQNNPPPAAMTGGGVEFAADPFHLDTVGLRMLLPVGSTAERAQIASKATVQITPADKTWVLNIQTPRTSNPDLTPAASVDEIATKVLEAAGEVYDREKPQAPVALKGGVLVPRTTIIIGDQTAERVYLRLPPERSQPAVIRGYTVFKTGATQFVTFELITTEATFNTARSVYESVVGTVIFEDPAKRGADRSAAIMAGRKVFERIDAETMKAVIAANGERWERLYRPSPTGATGDDTEVGYRRVRASIGRRGDLNADKPGTGAGDREPGYVIRMDARFLDKARVNDGKLSSGRMVDSQAVFFMSLDRAAEAWSVRNAVRDGKEVAVHTEMGARSGNSMTVDIVPSGQPAHTVRPVIQGDGYISRVEALLLGQLLVKAGVTTDFGFYTYQSDRETVRMRRDSLEQPPDRPGVWRLTTRLAEDREPQVALYNEKGLIQINQADGIVIEPTTYEKLLSIWKAKGLMLE